MGAFRSRTGCLVIPTRVYEDERGWFTECHRKAWDLPEFVQDNCSSSRPGVVRGLHFQTRNPQGKLVRCLAGQILDVALDLRMGSPTYGQWEMFQLHPEGDSVYIPPGFAHGFIAIDRSILFYKCTTEYDGASDGGINPLDLSLRLPWAARSPLILSDKDRALPMLREFKSPFTF